MICIRQTNMSQWSRLEKMLLGFAKADRFALQIIESEVKAQRRNLNGKLTDGVDGNFLRWNSVRRLSEFPRMVKVVGVVPKGFFVGVLDSDLHAWQASFTKKQLAFLKYVGKRSGVGADVGGEGVVSILPPTPFTFKVNVTTDPQDILKKLSRKLGFGG